MTLCLGCRVLANGPRTGRSDLPSGQDGWFTRPRGDLVKLFLVDCLAGLTSNA